MSSPPVRRPAQPRGLPAPVAVPRWRKREVIVSAVVAVTSAFIAWLAWTLPHSMAERLLHTAVSCGGLAAARAPRMLFIPTAWRDAQGAGLVIPLSALRLAQLGQALLLVAGVFWIAGFWLPVD